MAFKKLLKSALAVSLAGALGCEYYEPEGVQVKKDADGVLTAEEEKSIEEVIIAPGSADDFEPYKGFVNDFNVFTGREMRANSLPSLRFGDDLHIYLAKDRADVEDRWDSSRVMPNAFFTSPNSTIYVLQDAYTRLEFLSVFHHEAGHYWRGAEVYEFPSMKNEAYFAIRSYSFSRRVGSRYADLAINTRNCVPIDEYYVGDRNKYYAYGELGFFVFANLEDGNLEKALDKSLRAPRLYLEQKVVSTALQYSNLCEAYIGEFEKLLEKPGFFEGLRRNMSEEEAREFIDYLHLTAEDKIGHTMEQAGLILYSEKRDRDMRNAEQFFNGHNTNPFFRAGIAVRLTQLYSQDLGWLMGRAGRSAAIENKKAVHELAKRIIEINKDYPCEFEPFECRESVANARSEHTSAYPAAALYSTDMINQGMETPASLILLPEDYFIRFYPSGSLHYEDSQIAAAVYMPWMAYYAGNLELDMGSIAYRNGDNDGYVQHTCNAIEWFDRVLEASCSRVPDEAKRQECYSYVNVDERYVRNLISRYSSVDCSDYQQ